MSIFEWSDEYSVGVFQMDSHHKRLFGIMDKLNDAMLSGRAKETVPVIVAELLDYTKYHFTEEERLMEQANYPGLNSQKQAHQIFISKLEGYKKEADQGMGAFVSSKIMNSAKDWLLKHIMNMDKLYTQSMNSSGIS